MAVLVWCESAIYELRSGSIIHFYFFLLLFQLSACLSDSVSPTKWPNTVFCLYMCVCATALMCVNVLACTIHSQFAHSEWRSGNGSLSTLHATMSILYFRINFGFVFHCSKWDVLIWKTINLYSFGLRLSYADSYIEHNAIHSMGKGKS